MKKNDTGAVYPGSFDPVTNGHMDIIRRAARIFGRLTVAVLENSSKQTAFSTEERVAMLRESIQGIEGVEVRSFTGLLVDFMDAGGSRVIVRGLRFVSDYEYELQMALMNQSLREGIETFFMAARPSRTFVSSSLVKEIARYGRDVSAYVPAPVVAPLRLRMEEQQK